MIRQFTLEEDHNVWRDSQSGIWMQTDMSINESTGVETITLTRIPAGKTPLDFGRTFFKPGEEQTWIRKH